jgi:2'-5' RNA ligase
MRLFYAAYLSRENMDAYQALVESLIRKVPGTLRSVPHRTHHLTLGFLGEIEESDLERCSAVLDAIERFGSFEYTLDTPSLLIGRGRPRLIRAGVTAGGEQIRDVQAALISRLKGRLPSLETRTKPPHVTIARFTKGSDRAQARAVEVAIQQIGDFALPERDHFEDVHLVSSSLTPSGPVYKTLRQVRLSGVV